MERLQKAIKEWYEACAAHEKALGDYEGYSWGYHGYEYVERLQLAEKEFADAMQSVIREGIEEALAKKG